VEANRAQGLTILDRGKLAVINFKTEDFWLLVRVLVYLLTKKPYIP